MRPNDPSRAAPETPTTIRLADVLQDAAAAGLFEEVLRAVADLERRAAAAERRVLEQDDRIGELQQDNATLASNCDGLHRRVETLLGEVEELRGRCLDVQSDVDLIMSPDERCFERIGRELNRLK